MGLIRVKAIFYNAVDYARWIRGELAETSVRRAEADALVDTGSTYPALPKDIIEKLGLIFLGEVDGEVAEKRHAKLRLHGLAMVQVEDRIAECPVIERSKETSVIIGVVALEQMGFRIDPVTGKLVKGLPLMLQLRDLQ